MGENYSRSAERHRRLGLLQRTLPPELAPRREGCASPGPSIRLVLDGGARDADYILREDFPTSPSSWAAFAWPPAIGSSGTAMGS
jgi:hypothetical protein